MKGKTTLKPRTPLGVITREQLRRIARVVEAYDIPVVRATAGQRLMLAGIRPEDWEAVRAELGPCGETMKHYVQACPGRPACEFGLADSLEIGARLEGMLGDMDLPAKVKVGVSACPRSCGESLVRDLGLVGRRSGWTVYFGGNAGARPRIADELAAKLDGDEALALCRRVLAYYAANGKPKERTARFVERMGPDVVRQAVLQGSAKDCEGREEGPEG